jgi:hypothetical protein
MTRETEELQMCSKVTALLNNNNNNNNNNWSQWNSNTELKEKFGGYTRNTFDILFTKDGYTWNITRTAESTTV